MSLTLANAITEVRYTLNETTATFWTDAQITAWIQEGCRVFSSKTLMVEGTDSIDPLIANQLAYTSADETWLADVIEPYAAIYNNGSNVYKGLIKVHPRQIGNVATFTAGDPKYYSLYKRSIYVWPLATTAIAAAGQIDMLYAKETDDITALQDEYQHLPIIYATSKCKQKDSKFAEATSLMQQFLNEVNFERTDKHEREVDSSDSFQIPKGGTGAQGQR